MPISYFAREETTYSSLDWNIGIPEEVYGGMRAESVEGGNNAIEMSSAADSGCGRNT